MASHSFLSVARVRRLAHPGLRAGGPLPTTMALAALVAAVAGLLLPWVTVFHGFAPLNGIAAGGGTYAGLATASALLLLAAHRYAWAPGRWIALGAASAAVAGSLWIARSVADYASDPGPAAALASPVPGPGPWVLAAGAALVVVAVFLPLPQNSRGAGLDRAGLNGAGLAGKGRAGLGARLGLGATAFVAGWIHLLLVPEHWGESALLGAGFLGAAILQLALAISVVERPGHAAHLTLVVLNVALVGVWLYAVFVGLPLGDAHDHGGAAGWSIGAGEPIDTGAVVTKVAEIAGAVWAGVLISRPVRRPHGAGQQVQRARHRFGGAAGLRIGAGSRGGAA
ncbi:hypothetical protein RBS60_13755 [Sinomonas sp. ASV486]|uniref:hypothetical protein n=1 Tax=Sinomonas sp. ASV486 TaxID=3051170 RepID=UPI0027DD5823|nr:hypothetical protein [Sinomonas sp. ASV486]MDQ4491263.1 hypothetical protein [Sinomonas sp. ASV486]